MTDFDFVTPGALAYMVTTAKWMFFPADPTGLTSPVPEKDFSTTTDGPYSCYALAERAADMRLSFRADFLLVPGQMEPHGIGGHQGPHGNVCTWKRDLVWRDWTKDLSFGDQPGWQTIEIQRVDVLP